jgi:putative endonuclease
MAHMYILKCSDGSYYVGSTRNLESRLWQHQQGLGAEYTKHRLPVMLMYAYEFERVSDAFAMEKRVQGWSRRKREALIRGDYASLPGRASQPSQEGSLGLERPVVSRLRPQAASAPQPPMAYGVQVMASFADPVWRSTDCRARPLGTR